MPPFFSTTKAVGSVISRRNLISRFVKRAKNGERSGNLYHIRWVTTVSGVQPSSVHPSLGSRKEASIVPLNNFLIITHSKGDHFWDVATVKKAAFYQKFTRKGRHGRSDIIKRYPDGSFDAELEIGFKFLVESYVSHVELSRPKFVKSTASESGIFDHLINIWEFNPGPVPGTCNLYFLVDFKFQSPLYRKVASMFFKEVVSRMISSFSERCRLIYGPGVPVLENSYGDRT
ncbi:abscisic acid 8'-hydroxylase 4 [Hibiscus syriacus]|uniref:Abscisic acid 8'-hydroxylase 4 n=1 Tax=Hibiscus syriacus TaxID=106335 RepID=A0A6A2XL33_HIBSY|nr:abscisic acid 8'-hydroxylase 4 [Hibiscus syriacus]